jgi:hypothetical protein
MHQKFYQLHGPEHHFIIPLVILKYLADKGIALPSNYQEIAINHCSKLPGGICAYWGACAAAISIGITASVILETNPLKRLHYDTVHKITANALNKIALYGGPRCCKRNTMLSLESLLFDLKQYCGINIDHAPFECDFFRLNKECIHGACPYFPKHKEQ